MTCKQAIWKTSYWGFKGIQEMCLRLRVNMNSDIRDVAFSDVQELCRQLPQFFPCILQFGQFMEAFHFFQLHRENGSLR